MREVLESKLQVLAQDDLMLDAIKFVFSKRIDKEKPAVEKTDDDITLGQKYRAYEQAKTMLNEAICDINAYKEEKTETVILNKGK